MFKLKTREDCGSLPGPVALTPEQLKERATLTAGGLTLIPGVVTRAGPYPPMPYVSLGTVSIASLGVVNTFAV